MSQQYCLVPGRTSFAFLLVASLGATGCFRYVSIQPTAIRPNEEVRVRITEDAAVRLVREFGTFTGQLEGVLAPQGADSMSISVLIGRDYQGVTLGNVRQSLALARSEVVEVRRRQLSRGRTALATAGTLAAFGILLRSIIQEENPNTNDDNPPPPPPPFRASIRIPFL